MIINIHNIPIVPTAPNTKFLISTDVPYSGLVWENIVDWK